MVAIQADMIGAMLREDTVYAQALYGFAFALRDHLAPQDKGVFGQLANLIREHAARLEATSDIYTERLIELPVAEEKQKCARGRKRGSLSSLAEPKGTTVDDVIDMLKEAKRAREAQDGSFAELCRQMDIPESTMRSRLDNYADMIDRE